MRRVDSLILTLTSWCFVAAFAATAAGQNCGYLVDFEFEGHFTTTTGVPDSSLAIGSEYIMTTTNWGRRVWDRSGNPQIPVEDLTDFFGTSIDADAVVEFDRDSLRWFVVALKDLNKLALAVSQSSDPRYRTTWDFHFTDDFPFVPDYPTMSIGAEQVFVTWQRGFVTPGRADIAWIDKAALLNGQMPEMTKYMIDRIDGQDHSRNRVLGCLEMFDSPSPSLAYFITDSHTESEINNWVRLYALDAESGQPPSEFDLTVPTYKTAPGLVQRPDGMARCLPWFKFGVYRDGSAWVAHCIAG